MNNKWKGKCSNCPGCNRMELDDFEDTDDCPNATIFINDESEETQYEKKQNI